MSYLFKDRIPLYFFYVFCHKFKNLNNWNHARDKTSHCFLQGCIHCLSFVEIIRQIKGQLLELVGLQRVLGI